MLCDNFNTKSLHNSKAIKLTEQDFKPSLNSRISLDNPRVIKNKGQGLPPLPRYQIKAVPIGKKLNYKNFKNPVLVWNTSTGLTLDKVFELEEAMKLVERSRTCPPMVDTKPKDCFWRHENCWNARAIERNHQLSLNLGQGGAE